MGVGLDAQIGFAAETEYGKFKAPTRFLPFESETLSLDKTYVKTMGLQAGVLVQSEALHQGTTRTVAGDVSLQFLDQGMGILLNLLHGETVTPEKIGETIAYKQIHKIGLTRPAGKSLTTQVGKPGDEVFPFSYLGCKIIEMKFTVEQSGTMALALTLDGADEVTVEALGEATFDAGALPFTFQQLVPKIKGAAVANMRSISFTIPIAQHVERFNMGNEGTKDEPMVNAPIAITGEAKVEFATLADHNRYKEEEVVELALEGTGGVIVGENKFAVNITIPAVKQVVSSPQVAGPDLLESSVTFETLKDETNAPMTIETISTDSAL